MHNKDGVLRVAVDYTLSRSIVKLQVLIEYKPCAADWSYARLAKHVLAERTQHNLHNALHQHRQ